jgi:hypothetical protein
MSNKLRVKSRNGETLLAIERRDYFETHGGLWADRYDSGFRAWTDLLPEYYDRLIRYRPDDVDYVVFSYNTPIAWHLRSTDAWIIPNVKYSATTSTHQSVVRQALNHYLEV